MSDRLQTVALSNLSRPDGSAVYSFGNTVIQCNIYGPGEVNQSKEKVDKTTVEVVFKKRIKPVNRDSPDVKMIEDFIRTNLEAILYTNSHPRSLLMIFIHELQNDGSLMSSCLNAACCALIDSGFPMKYLFASTTAIIDGDQQIIVNPNKEQMNNCKSCFTITFDSIDHKILSITTQGGFTFLQYQQCLKACKESSGQIFKMYKDAAKKRYK